MIGDWVLSLINVQFFTFPTNVELLPTLLSLAIILTLTLKCEPTMSPLKWKFFLLLQTLIPHRTFLAHHPCGVVDTLRWNVSYSPLLLHRWLSIQVSQSLSRTKDPWYQYFRSFSLGSIEHWKTFSFRGTPLWETYHIFT